MILNNFVDSMGNESQKGFWQIKAQATLKTGITVFVYWCKWDGCIASVEMKAGEIVGLHLRDDEIVTPDYVVIKNYVWTDDKAPWLYLPA